MNKLLSFVKSKWAIFAIIAGIMIGFFFGMEYKSYQIRQSFKDIGKEFSKGLSQAFSGNADTNYGSDNNTDNINIKEADVLSNEEKNSYISNLDISVNVKEYVSFLDSGNKYNGKARSLVGTIKNNGDKDIKDAELLIIFLDDSGKSMYENIYNPLYNSNKFDSIVLKPNYVNEFSFNTDGVPSGWAGKIQYKINNIDY